MVKVVSDKMDKTIVVAVEDRVAAPQLYKKIIEDERTSLKAHDENNECGIGDRVKCDGDAAPCPRTRDGVVVEIIEKAK